MCTHGMAAQGAAHPHIFMQRHWLMCKHNYKQHCGNTKQGAPPQASGDARWLKAEQPHALCGGMAQRGTHTSGRSSYLHTNHEKEAAQGRATPPLHLPNHNHKPDASTMHFSCAADCQHLRGQVTTCITTDCAAATSPQQHGSNMIRLANPAASPVRAVCLRIRMGQQSGALHHCRSRRTHLAVVCGVAATAKTQVQPLQYS
jgi:hypothetical protein